MTFGRIARIAVLASLVIFLSVFLASSGSDFITAGGRVLTVVGNGDDYASAIARAYEAVDKITFEGMQFRRDIAAKATLGFGL